MAAYDFRAFIDDSGNDPQEAWFLLAGWVGTVPEWEFFTEDWQRALDHDPAIRYFKHNEAQGRKGCFAGFSDKEVDTKGRLLASVIVRHNIYPVSTALRHDVHRDVFQAQMPRRRDKLHAYFQHPLYLCFNNIIPLVLQLHYDKKFEGKVDFVFDAGKVRPDKTTRRCIDIYNSVKEQLRDVEHSFYPLMGTALGADDEEVLPLQAADFLAGQMRLAKILNDYMPPALRDLATKKIVYHELSS